MRRKTRRRTFISLVVLVACVIVFPFVNVLTCHPGETAILPMPPMLGTILWLGWTDVRRVSLRRYAVYGIAIMMLMAGAEWIAAYAVGGRIYVREVLLAAYFVVAWRMAWALWKRTVDQVGERRLRSARIKRHKATTNAYRIVLIPSSIHALRFLLVACVFAPLFAGSLIHRVKIGNDPALRDDYIVPIDDVRIPTMDGLTLSGWFARQNNSDATIIVCHGFGANKGNFLPYVSVFHGYSYNALIFDFRGHGESDGHTSTCGLYESRDVLAAVDWLKRERPNEARHVFGIGSSMGAMALVRAAADDPRIEAVVLDSAFASAEMFAESWGRRLPVLGPVIAELGLTCVSLHAGRSFRALDAVGPIGRLTPRPVLLIHGEDDFVIPSSHMDILYEAAGEPKQKWLGPGPHSNILTVAFDDYRRRVVGFFDAYRY